MGAEPPARRRHCWLASRSCRAISASQSAWRCSHVRSSRRKTAKRYLVHVAAFNLRLLMRKVLVVGTPRELANRLARVLAELSGHLCALVARLVSHLEGRGQRRHRPAKPESWARVPTRRPAVGPHALAHINWTTHAVPQHGPIVSDCVRRSGHVADGTQRGRSREPRIHGPTGSRRRLPLAAPAPSRGILLIRCRQWGLSAGTPRGK